MPGRAAYVQIPAVAFQPALLAAHRCTTIPACVASSVDKIHQMTTTMPRDDESPAVTDSIILSMHSPPCQVCIPHHPHHAFLLQSPSRPGDMRPTHLRLPCQCSPELATLHPSRSLDATRSFNFNVWLQ